MSNTRSMLRLYRQLLYATKKLNHSNDAAQNTLRWGVDDVRQAFRTHQHEQNTAKIETLREEAEDKLKFMRLMLPNQDHYYLDVVCQPSDELHKDESGTKKYVVRDGKVVEDSAQSRDSAPHSNWGGNNVDPDDLKRHNAQMRRFHFMDRGVPPPRGPVW